MAERGCSTMEYPGEGRSQVRVGCRQGRAAALRKEGKSWSLESSMQTMEEKE